MSNLASYYQGFDRPLNNKFRLQIRDLTSNSTIEIGVAKITGVDDSSSTVKYREGSEPDVQHVFYGLSDTSVIVMERAISLTNTASNSSNQNNADYFVQWREKCREFGRGGPDLLPQGTNESGSRRLVLIESLDHAGNAVASWKAFNCICSKQSFTDFDAMANDLMREIIELTPEAVRRGVGKLSNLT